ncbi:MAG: DMT family transporter [Phyllobacteriaceae bacterium]|nr:DMT family transporter [Phyllobacteriaceae bacterium]
MSVLLGPLFKVISTLAFAVMLVGVKLLSGRIPAGEVVFFRSAFALMPVVAMVAWQGELREGLKTDRPGGHLIRSVVGVTAMALWFSGVQRISLADSLAITYAAPLLTVALAAILLGETVRFHRWSAVAVGFLGVLVVLSPHLGELSHLLDGGAATGAAMCFVYAFFMAFAQIQVRSLTRTERTGAIVVYFSLGSALVALLTVPWWVMPDGRDFAILLMTGIFGGIGQIFLTLGYRHADASVIAPLEYTSMLWAVATGWWFFGEWPTSTVLLGSTVIIASGIAIVLRERALGLKRREE